MKILQINTSVNTGSVGRVASEIGKLLTHHGHESTIAYGRTSREDNSRVVKIGNRLDFLTHAINTRLFDRHGFSSQRATVKFVDRIKRLDPELIHLHNIHGYYLHIGVLFNYLKIAGIPVVWTFHDCWPFTGHCSYFDRYTCSKWQTECNNCPLLNGYPKSWFLDNSRVNYQQKKKLFTGIENMTLVTPCEWLANHLSNSFLSKYPLKVINYGVSLEKFKPFDPGSARFNYNLNGKYIVLGVANIWDQRKGLADFIQLRTMLNSNIEIVLVGLKPMQIQNLPDGIRGISRTESIEDLASLYSTADVFLNLTYADNFPLVNLEALACGTPVITYDTGGCPEAIDQETGRVVAKGNMTDLVNTIYEILERGTNYYSTLCRKRAERMFNKDKKYLEYLKLYEKLTE